MEELNMQMLSINNILDLVKQAQNIKSERKLSEALGLPNMHDYRIKGTVPSPKKCLKIAKLSGLKPEIVIACCGYATAIRKKEDEVAEIWEIICKKCE